MTTDENKLLYDSTENDTISDFTTNNHNYKFYQKINLKYIIDK